MSTQTQQTNDTIHAQQEECDPQNQTSPPSSTSPRMSLSPQASAVFDPNNAQFGYPPMNNFVLSGTPQSPNLSQFVMPNQNVQALQQQIQQMQMQLQMMQQFPVQAQIPQPGVVPQQSVMVQPGADPQQLQLQQMQMQMQLLQQQQIQAGMGNLSLNPTPNAVATGTENIQFGIAGSYASPVLLSQMELANINVNIKEAIATASMDASRLINIIGKYTPKQMNQIIEYYKSTSGGQSLESAIKGVTSGNFGKLCVGLSKTILEYDTWCLYDAIKGLGTDDDCLIDVLVGRTNADIIALTKSYKEMYKKSLEDDVKGDTSGDYRTTLVSILQGSRNESNISHDVESDVDALYKAGEGKVGTTESTFINILTNRSYSHLREVFDKYHEKYKKSMDKVINSEFSGNIKKLLNAIVRTTIDYNQYIAEQFENSMKGIGTRNDKLIRLVIRYREPLQMKKIKEEYYKIYGKTLAKRIEGETSGDYRKLLLTCIGEK